jgi:hypothetical protein
VAWRGRRVTVRKLATRTAVAESLFGTGRAGGSAEPGLRRAAAKGGEVTTTVTASLAIAGRVVRRDGTPVPAVRVFLVAGDGTDVLRDAALDPVAATTDADGGFVLRGLPSAAFRLDVAASTAGDRGTCRTVSGPVRAGAADVRVVVEAGRAVHGRVLDAAGAGVAGAEVRCWSTDPASVSAASARTAGDGRFAVKSLDATPHVLRVLADGYATARREVPASGDEITVRLVAAGATDVEA